MNAVVPVGSGGGGSLIPQDMDAAIRLAKVMASAKLVPKHLQDDVGSCLMVVEQAMRWNMSPFAVAQCTSVIQGRLQFEGKLISAACESVGAIEGGFDYQFEGAGDDRTIIVSARRRGEATPRSIRIRLGDVKTSNVWWTRQPDQQLVYSGTRNWTRRWAPSVLLGAYAPEEFGDSGFDGVTIEATAADAPAVPTATSQANPREEFNAAVPMPDVPEMAAAESAWLRKFDAALETVKSQEEWDQMMSGDNVRAFEARELSFPARREFREIKERHMQRLFPTDLESDPT